MGKIASFAARPALTEETDNDANDGHDAKLRPRPLVPVLRPRKIKRLDLISDALPFGRLWYAEPTAASDAIGSAKHRSRSHDAVIRVYDAARRKPCKKRLLSSRPNESKTPEEYLSDALDLMVKAKWLKRYGPSAKGLGVDWTDRGKLAMEALGYVIEDLGPENFNQQLWWAVGTLANMEFTSEKRANLLPK